MQLRTDPSQPTVPGAPGTPRHVAIIMDGNGRWAKMRGLPRLAGHRAGAGRIQKVLETLGAKGVQHVTLFAFSTENWNRPPGEVQGIMDLLSHALKEQTPALHRKNVRVIHMGNADRLSPALRAGVAAAQELTRHNTGVTLNVAFNYGGRDEILEAVRRIIRDQISPDAVDQQLFSSYLYSAHSPDPDLIIRTGGELRVSNFLLWQSAYSEYYPTPTLWPDLEAAELEQALETFASRQRRFGSVTSEA